MLTVSPSRLTCPPSRKVTITTEATATGKNMCSHQTKIAIEHQHDDQPLHVRHSHSKLPENAADPEMPGALPIEIIGGNA